MTYNYLTPRFCKYSPNASSIASVKVILLFAQYTFNFLFNSLSICTPKTILSLATCFSIFPLFKHTDYDKFIYFDSLQKAYY